MNLVATGALMRVRPCQDTTSEPVPALGFYVRVGHNDQGSLLHLLAAGEEDIFGFVIDANYIERHRELIIEARRRNLDVILDPKVQQMGFPGGHSRALAALPWGLERQRRRF